MKRETLFLKIVIVLMGVPILGPYLFLFPWMIRVALEMKSELTFLNYLFVVSLYATAIPFFFALYQTYKILSYIDQNIAFSEFSTKALKKIKHCAIAISLLCFAGMPLVYIVAEADDAPGLIVLGLIVIFASIVIGVFTAVLEKLLKHALEIKSENDLTV